jgi:hypothetical protein
MIGSSMKSIQVVWDLKMLIHQVSIGFIGEENVLGVLHIDTSAGDVGPSALSNCDSL